MFSYTPESATAARSILATTILLGKDVLEVWFKHCSECSHDNKEEGKELEKAREATKSEWKVLRRKTVK